MNAQEQEITIETSFMIVVFSGEPKGFRSPSRDSRMEAVALFLEIVL